MSVNNLVDVISARGIGGGPRINDIVGAVNIIGDVEWLRTAVFLRKH